jgi:hypothetical protein
MKTIKAAYVHASPAQSARFIYLEDAILSI